MKVLKANNKPPSDVESEGKLFVSRCVPNNSTVTGAGSCITQPLRYCTHDG